MLFRDEQINLQIITWLIPFGINSLFYFWLSASAGWLMKLLIIDPLQVAKHMLPFCLFAIYLKAGKFAALWN
jgi:hypothetical protein